MTRRNRPQLLQGLLDSLTPHEDGYTCQMVLSVRKPGGLTEERYNIGFSKQESCTLSCNGIWIWKYDVGELKIHGFKNLLDQFLASSRPVMVYLKEWGSNEVVYKAEFIEVQEPYVLGVENLRVPEGASL